MTGAVTSALGAQNLKMYCFNFLLLLLLNCFICLLLVLLVYNPGHLGRGNWAVEKSMIND